MQGRFERPEAPLFCALAFGRGKGMIWSVVLGAILVAVGIFAFLRPDWVWKLTEQWKSYSADEPSDLYVASMKFGGVLMALAGIGAAVLPFILE